MTRFSAAILRAACWMAGVLLFGVLTACGGGSDSSAPPVHQPSISSLTYSPTSAMQAAGATATVSGTFAFHDAGGDIASVRIASSGGADVVTPTPQLGGMPAGTAFGQVLVPLDQPGRYTFEVWVTDSMGASSNRLSGTFEVLASQPATHAPTLSSMSFSPNRATQLAGGTAMLSGSVNFMDTGKDVARLELTASWGATQSFSLTDKQGVASGTIQYSVAVPLSQVGVQTFEIVAFDSQGAKSNRLGGTLEVAAAIPPTHVPVATSLAYSPTLTSQVPGGTALVHWTIGFSDSQGDIAQVRVYGGGGISATVDTPSLTGVNAGETSGAFSLSVASSGVYTFEIWVVDRAGAASNRLSGMVEVRPPAAAGTLYGIAWDGHLYVAVGTGGTVSTSTDLATWTPRTSGVTQLLRSVTASPLGFVAVGDPGTIDGEGVVLTSTDGATWAVRYRAGQCVAGACASHARLSKVIWAGTQFVAVGDEHPSGDQVYALILTSPDGLTWTQRAARKIVLGDPDYIVPLMTSVAWSGSQFVAVGLDGNDFSPKAWRSVNLEDWTAVGFGVDSVDLLPVGDIAWGNGRFVVVGPSGIYNEGGATYGHAPAFVSSDGTAWQAGPSSARLPPMSAVAAGTGGYMAVGDGFLETSPDGITWTVAIQSGCGKAILWDGARYVAVGESVCILP